MLVAMTAMLVSVAEFSNILSVLAVLMCFCAMFLLIMRNMTVFWLHGEELMFGGNAVHPVQQRIPQMKMMKVHIPFTFKLHETSNSSYSDLRCTISSQVPYTLQAFWGVSIRELHHFLWKAWSSFQTAVKDDSLLRGHYQHCGLTLHETSHTEKTIQMFMPEGKLDLGTPPRHCYPLVIFLIRDTPENSTLHPDETVALVNVVHIRDNVCTLPTNILAQYLKQANGQLSSLKQLYLATGNALSYQDDACSDDASQRAVVLDNGGGSLNTSQEQLCVVCQYYPLSRALLPCRHTCICASCFGKLETCPMCRSPIKSYFCVRNEDYLADCALGLEKTGASAKRQAFSQWIQNSITEFLGLH
ncbi:cell growth regulator with RING finger domain protein 1 isoform X1 [Acyrthosiphon pisum]|uniref:RING-type domain-containing protein n=2 Tax=Acyrthosiphon pisum TaxID=7029 RepID=A0A8R2AAY4_ACYPI|nr:cell growth regulator with RING finger domain protein 1 isoform X1 [Acyrthosiphon pisum]|eukprot:XP_001945098.2 PREDICTED: cell growth regulator with RING finger domain protein 1 [Acyrthosiphon pisum]